MAWSSLPSPRTRNRPCPSTTPGRWCRAATMDPAGADGVRVDLRFSVSVSVSGWVRGVGVGGGSAAGRERDPHLDGLTGPHLHLGRFHARARGLDAVAARRDPERLRRAGGLAEPSCRLTVSEPVPVRTTLMRPLCAFFSDRRLRARCLFGGERNPAHGGPGDQCGQEQPQRQEQTRECAGHSAAGFIRSPPSDPSSRTPRTQPRSPRISQRCSALPAARQSASTGDAGSCRPAPSSGVPGPVHEWCPRAASFPGSTAMGQLGHHLCRHRQALEIRHHPAAVLRLDVLPQLQCPHRGPHVAHHGRRDAPPEWPPTGPQHRSRKRPPAVPATPPPPRRGDRSCTSSRKARWRRYPELAGGLLLG